MSDDVSPNAVATSLCEHGFSRVVAELDDSFVKVAKVRSSLAWRSHENEEQAVMLNEGEAFAAPKGVRRNPIASDECHVMPIERKSTLHTGREVTAHARRLAEQLRSV